MRRPLDAYVRGDHGPSVEALDSDVELWRDPQSFPEGGGRVSGAPVQQVWTVSYKLRDGKIVRIEYHPDKERALKAIGADERGE